MGHSTRANDWEVQIVANVGGAVVIGGACTFLIFKSRRACVEVPVIFMGYGLGMGGSANGGSMPSPQDILRNRMPNLYTRIQCDRFFSLNDLHRSGGRISSIGAGVVLGYGAAYISAGLWDPCFTSQGVTGLSISTGAAALCLAGLWIVTR